MLPGNKIIRVIIENAPGALSHIAQTLADSFINIEDIEAISFGDKGIIRLQTSNDEKALRILEEKGFVTAYDDITMVALPHNSGALAEITKILADNDINIHSARVMDKTENAACVLVTTDDREKTREVLKDFLL